MNSMMEKLLEKKKKEGKEMSPLYKDSKMSMLKALRDEMSGMMKDDLQNPSLKKVEVASDSSEGLKKGLDKAKDLLASKGGSDEGDPSGPDSEDKPGEGIRNPADESMDDAGEELKESAEESMNEDEGSEDHHMLMDAYKDNPSKENLGKLMSHLEKKKAQME